MMSAVKIHELAECIKPDVLAECYIGISDEASEALYLKIWNEVIPVMADEQKEFCTTDGVYNPDFYYEAVCTSNDGTWGLDRYWHLFTDAEKMHINRVIEESD